jgi:RNA polymerase sigma factor (sigma-70 family)
MPEEPYSDSRWAEVGLDAVLIHRINSAVTWALVEWCRDPQERSDVIQETWLQILQHWHELRDRAKAVPWAVTIARRIAGERSVRDKKETVALRRPDALATQMSEEARVDWSDADLERIVLALGALKGRELDVLVLEYYSGLTASQIARILGTKEATIHQAQTRARKALRSRIEAQPSKGAGQKDALAGEARAPCLDSSRLQALEECLGSIHYCCGRLSELEEQSGSEEIPDPQVAAFIEGFHVRSEVVARILASYGRIQFRVHQLWLQRPPPSLPLRSLNPDRGLEQGRAKGCLGVKRRVA